ncbi:hypothetical protein NBRC116584_37000 [Hydrogenophaga sp. 5NK40-0174]
MKVESVEHAYKLISTYLLAFADDRSWDLLACKIQIFEKMATGRQWLHVGGETVRQGGFRSSPYAVWDGMDAALFLRDDLLRSTGQRIWGLTFTLYPDGKFNIEYDYNKPEGYEETDEVITGDEINASLDEVMNKRDGD